MSTNDPQPVFILVKALARPDKIEAAKQAFAQITGPIRANPDCLDFHVYYDRHDPRSFTLLERWVSEAAVMAHGKQAYIADYMAQKDELFELLVGSFLEELK